VTVIATGFGAAKARLATEQKATSRPVSQASGIASKIGDYINPGEWPYRDEEPARTEQKQTQNQRETPIRNAYDPAAETDEWDIPTVLRNKRMNSDNFGGRQ
ncbi:MAG: hypothetical protein QHH01_02130, partial [Spirochaetales bacterium]|nr:hypothetical protein [Spirochaetales bacterium]